MNIVLNPKISKETVEAPNKTGKKSGLPIENYYANGVLVLSNNWHMEDFVGKARKSVDRIWNKAGLQKLLDVPANAINSFDFPNSYPDTVNGTVGKPATQDFVRLNIENFVLSNNVKLTNIGNVTYWGGFVMKFGMENFALRSKIFTARSAYQKDFAKAPEFADTLLSNFGTVGKYMAYDPDEVKRIIEIVGTPEVTKLKQKMISAWEKIPQKTR
jgi:hypothetical protein